MALTILVLGAEGDPEELSLTLDAPRIVIGRGAGCEVRLPDASVSQRHASIRQRGAEYTLVDEGSLNGTAVGRRPLAPRAPEPLRDGDRVRVGRVWFEVRIGPAVPTAAPAVAARELALALVARGLRAQGEDPTPRVQVIAGPDEGLELLLEEAGRPYTLGRGGEADLSLSDPAAGRRHLCVTRRGDQIVARDLGAPGGTLLDGAPLPTAADVGWRPGQVVALGATRLACEHPAVEALAELERCPDEPVRAAEIPEPPGGAEPAPPPSDAAPEPASTPAPDTAAPPAAAPAARRRALAPAPPPRAGWGFTDAAVVLLALGVLAVSIAGLVWLLDRG